MGIGLGGIPANALNAPAGAGAETSTIVTGNPDRDRLPDTNDPSPLVVATARTPPNNTPAPGRPDATPPPPPNTPPAGNNEDNNSSPSALAVGRIASVGQCDGMPIFDGRGGGVTTESVRVVCLGNYALAEIGAHAKQAFAAVADALNGADALRREAATQDLNRMNRAITGAMPILLAGFGSPHAGVHNTAANTLTEIGEYSDAVVPVLQGLARDPEPAVQRAAVAALGDLGPYSTPALTTLAALLDDDDLVVRLHASGGVLKIDASIASTAAALSQAMLTYSDYTPEVGNLRTAAVPNRSALWQSALGGLETIGPDGRRAVGELVATGAVDAAVVTQVGDIGWASAAAVPPVVQALDDPDYRPGIPPDVRFAGDLDLLLTAVKDPRPDVRASAARALETTTAEVRRTSDSLAALKSDGRAQSIMTESVIEGTLEDSVGIAETSVGPLVGALGDDDSAVRAAAATSLGHLAMPATHGVAAADLSGSTSSLANCLEDPDQLVRYRCTRTLGYLGAAARPTVPNLEAALASNDIGLRYQAARSLDRIEPLPEARVELVARDAEAAVAQLLEQIKGPEPAAQRQAVLTLSNVGAAGVSGIFDLAAYIPEAEPAFRPAVTSSLSRISAAGLEEVEDLGETLARSDDEVVRGNAAKVLGNIGANARATQESLSALLERDEVDPSAKLSIAEALGYVSEYLTVAVRGLVDAATEDRAPDVRELAADATEDIAEAEG